MHELRLPTYGKSNNEIFVFSKRFTAVDFVGIEGAIFSSLFVRVMNHVLGWFEGQLHWIVDVDLKNGDKEFLFSPVG